MSKRDDEDVNINLLHSLGKIRTQISILQQERSDSKFKMENETESYESPQLDIVDHVKEEMCIGEQVYGTATLSDNLSALTSKILVLKDIYSTHIKQEVNDVDLSLSQESDTTNIHISDNSKDNILKTSMADRLSTSLSNLTEQVTNLISVYKTDNNIENANQIKKCLSRINKKIKSISSQNYKNDLVRSSESPNSLVNDITYDTAFSNLAEKVIVLNKKISKLSSIYKKKFNLNNKKETSENNIEHIKKNDVDKSKERIEEQNHTQNFNTSGYKKKCEATENGMEMHKKKRKKEESVDNFNLDQTSKINESHSLNKNVGTIHHDKTANLEEPTIYKKCKKNTDENYLSSTEHMIENGNILVKTHEKKDNKKLRKKRNSISVENNESISYETSEIEQTPINKLNKKERKYYSSSKLDDSYTDVVDNENKIRHKKKKKNKNRENEEMSIPEINKMHDENNSNTPNTNVNIKKSMINNTDKDDSYTYVGSNENKRRHKNENREHEIQIQEIKKIEEMVIKKLKRKRKHYSSSELDDSFTNVEDDENKRKHKKKKKNENRQNEDMPIPEINKFNKNNINTSNTNVSLKNKFIFNNTDHATDKITKTTNNLLDCEISQEISTITNTANNSARLNSAYRTEIQDEEIIKKKKKKKRVFDEVMEYENSISQEISMITKSANNSTHLDSEDTTTGIQDEEIKKKKRVYDEVLVEKMAVIEKKNKEDRFSSQIEDSVNIQNEIRKTKKKKSKKDKSTSRKHKKNKSLTHTLLDAFLEKMNNKKTEENDTDQLVTENSLSIKTRKTAESRNNKHSLGTPENSDAEDLYSNLVKSRTDLYDSEKFLLVQALLEESQENNVISDEIKEKLRNMVVLIPWEVPPVHQIETRLAIGPTKIQREILEKYNIKCGQFTKDEDDMIKRNWRKFCKEHDVDEDPKPFLALQHGINCCMPFGQRKRFIQFLGRNLEHRMLSSIYRRFRILSGNFKKGRFTKEEDEIILAHVNNVHNGQSKFAPLERVLKRRRQAIETRFKVLLAGDDKSNNEVVHWDLDKKQALLMHLMRILKVKDFMEIRHLDIKPRVWSEIGKLMNIHPYKIKLHWHIRMYTQLFACKPFCWNDIKIEVVEKLSEMKIHDWKIVNWQELASNFPGISSHFLWLMLKSAVRHNVPQKLHTDLKACLKHLKENFVPQTKALMASEEQMRNRRKVLHDGTRPFCRLRLNDKGKLELYF